MSTKAELLALANDLDNIPPCEHDDIIIRAAFMLQRLAADRLDAVAVSDAMVDKAWDLLKRVTAPPTDDRSFFVLTKSGVRLVLESVLPDEEGCGEVTQP